MNFVKLLAVGALVLTASNASAMDFGDDSGDYPNDGLCDDRRFEGTGMAENLSWANVGRDAEDCSRAFNAKTISRWDLSERVAQTECSAIEFGNNASEYAGDGACDDPRFEGMGAAELPGTAHIGRDADDCSRLCSFDMIFMREGMDVEVAVEVEDPFYGDNEGEYARDGECDDRRFAGGVMAEGLRWDLVGHDADDCRVVYEQGLVSLWDPAEAAAQTDCAAIDFGDDSSEYALDGICDDRRFEGRGAAAILVTGYEGVDATDCARLCTYDLISLRDLN